MFHWRIVLLSPTAKGALVAIDHLRHDGSTLVVHMFEDSISLQGNPVVAKQTLF